MSTVRIRLGQLPQGLKAMVGAALEIVPPGLGP